jgi:hypothetical protein
MKKVFILFSILSVGILFSQNKNDKRIEFGITAGYNFNSFDDLLTTGGLNNTTEKTSSNEKSGYHAGIYLKIKLPKIYIRPEVVYTALKSEFESATYDQSQIDIPLLVGYKIIGPLSVFTGPSFQYILENKFEGVDTDDISIENDLAVNFQVGFALQLGNQIRLDARYEKGLSNNIVTLLDQDIILDGLLVNLDTKSEQFIVSISLQL